MKKTISLIALISVMSIGTYSFYAVTSNEVWANAVIPKYTDVVAKDLLHLDKEAIADLAENLAGQHKVSATIIRNVSNTYLELLIVTLSMLFAATILLVYLAFQEPNQSLDSTPQSGAN